MSEWVVYYYAKCDTCNRTVPSIREIANSAQVQVKVVDFVATPLKRAELEDLVSRFDKNNRRKLLKVPVLGRIIT